MGQPQRERRWVELPRQELIGEPVERAPPAAGALADRLPQRDRLDTGLDAHREDLGQRGLHDVAGAVVNELRDRARADGPDVVGLIADRVENRLVTFEHVLVAADPESQATRLGATRPAAHRRVEHVDPLLLELFVDPPHERRRVGREIEIDFPGSEPRAEPLCAEGHRFDFHRPGQRREHDVGRLGDGARCVGPGRPGFQVRRCRLAAHVVDHELVAALHQVGRHVASHRAEPDESDLHGFLASNTLRAIVPAVMAAGQPA